MILAKPTKYAVYPVGDSLTEQEHKDSCDINIMLRNNSRGLQIRGGGSTDYGYDDTTMDAVQFRILKAALEEQLLNGQKEFTQPELDLLPPDVIKKFGYTLKKQAIPVLNDDQNDEPDQKQPKKPAKAKIKEKSTSEDES